MTTKKYIQPETDVVPLSTKDEVMTEVHPGEGTSDQWTNTYHMDNDLDDGLDNAYTPHQVNPWDD